MARACDRAITIAIIMMSIVTHYPVDRIAADLIREVQVSDDNRLTKPMILPLVLSYPNTSRHRGVEKEGRKNVFSRRQLQKAETHGTVEARMRLYDDLLTNGYYTTRLFIGTPPQEFALIVDSGSTVTYVPCSTCEQCGNHQDPRFNPEHSNSYKPVKCSTGCNCDSEKNQCIYERQYAEMSSSSGVLGEDLVSFGNESSLEPQNAIFGCENMETGDLFSQHADGIMGLGRGHLSIMDQLVEKGVISDSFSLCYGGMDVGGGTMVLGGISFPSDMVFTRSDPIRSPYYNIELKEIHVSGKSLQLNPSVFDGKHGTVLDSGTTYAYLPEPAFLALRDSVIEHVQHLQQLRGPDPTYKDICFSGAGSDVSQLSKTFPEVELVFSNEEKLLLSPENYLFRHSKVPGAYCLGIFQNGRDPTTLLGGILVRNTLVTYDRENERIGFWKTNCSDLWERLQLHGASAPAPAVPSHTPDSYVQISSTTPSMAPSQSPSLNGMQDQNVSALVRVGLITFDMSLSINYSVMKPHIPELRELMADHLEVNVSQVHVLNFQSEGNGSLIRWTILPARADGFISSATVTAIISRLTKHRVHLPDNFGSYQLLEWKVEPVTKRTWLQRHALIVALLLGTFALLSISVLILYSWRRRQGSGLYRPVDAHVPEHELQPL